MRLVSDFLATPLGRAAFASLIAIPPAYLVYTYGWISEDGFITFRYASNLLDGHGPVFNVGDRVQGYTHPLWLGFLTLGLVVSDNPLYIAVGLGVLITLLGLTAVNFALITLSANRFHGLLSAALLCGIFVSSESWLSFQTGGLENPLSHLLILLLVILVFVRPDGAYLPLSMLVSLVWLTRPDFAPMLIPLAAVALYQAYRARRLPELLAGFLPALAWLVFARGYYGEFLPNTADAKVGIYDSWSVAAEHGLRYIQDWIQFEPLAATASIVSMTAAVLYGRGAREYAIVLGAGLYLLYVVLVGGDFMRGRFMLGFFVVTTAFGALLLASRGPVTLPIRRYAFLGVSSLALFLLLNLSRPVLNAEVSQHGIGNERLFYSGLSLESYRANDELRYAFYDLDWIDQLKNYSEVCGGVTMHTATVGIIGYYAGDRVTIIDTIGLNDDFIADLPRENLIAPPRVGHPFKYIPISYLAGRGDISIFEGWEEAINTLDCEYKSRTEPYILSDELYHPLQPIQP